MEIIALAGPGSSGKTSTINLVYNRVLAAGGVSMRRLQLGGNRHDFEDIVNYKGKKVAFFSMGDYSGALIAAIQRYNAIPVDVFVCATNTRFVKPIPFIRTFPHHHIIPKTIASATLSEVIANDRDASTIFGLI
jgi:hypothetical protein